jgi:hypothetical protein
MPATLIHLKTCQHIFEAEPRWNTADVTFERRMSMSERIPDLLVAVLAASIAVVSTVASATPCADLLWTRTDTEKVRAEPVWKLHALLREYRAAAATPLRHSRGDRGRVINLDHLEPVGNLVSAARGKGVSLTQSTSTIIGAAWKVQRRGP